MTHAQLITWTLDNQPQLHAPGTRHLYSNFGYCLLGRVIEAVSGLTYAEYVRRNVLAPSGISNMHLEGDTLAQRRSDEVVYYGTNPYGIPARRMDAHGGWLASPTDVLRFAVRADGFATVPDLLRRDTVTTMTTPPAVHDGYACGWAVNKAGSWWHTGRLTPNGTEAVLVRTASEFCWAAASNGNRVDLDAMMWDVHRAVALWPSHNLF